MQREKAWSIRPWPCTGIGNFFAPTLPKLSCYAEILSRIKSGGKILDLGCYCGTDLRRLALDGCPQENLYGTDLINHWDLGFALYRDEHKFHATYVEADFLHPNTELLGLAGKVDAFSTIHFLHNWDWETQLKAATAMCSLSTLGNKVVGAQVGTQSKDSTKWIREGGQEGFKAQSVESFARLWEVAGGMTGTKWETDAEIRDWEVFGYRREETKYLGEGAGILEFAVTRVE